MNASPTTTCRLCTTLVMLCVAGCTGGGVGKEGTSTQSPAGVTVAATVAQVRPVVPTLSAIGAIAAGREVVVTAETMGKVRRLRAALGQAVNKSAALVEVDSVLKQAAYLAVSARAEKANKDAERARVLHHERDLSESDLEVAQLAQKSAQAELIVAKRQLDDTVIRAPFAGYLTERFVDVGAFVQPGAPIAVVVDLSTVKLRVAVNERDLAGLSVGDEAKVSTDVYPDQVFVGTIQFIGYKADAARAYPVEVHLTNNRDHPLRAGLTARVTFTLARRQALLVPRMAVGGTKETPVVFTVEHGRARRRQVRLGAEQGTDVEVASGLRAGEAVVSSGLQNVDDGTVVLVKASAL